MLEMILKEMEKMAAEGILNYTKDKNVKLIEITFNRYFTNRFGEVKEKFIIDEENYEEEYDNGNYYKETIFDEVGAEKFLDKICEYHKTVDKNDVKVWTFDWCDNKYELLLETGYFEKR